MNISDLYQQTILEHAKAPRNAGRLASFTHSAFGKNPLCGDALELMLDIQDGIIVDLSFVGEGCAISQASCSLLTVEIKGKTLEEANTLLTKMTEMLTEHDVEGLPKRLQVLSGVRAFPARVKCAMLGWRTYERALQGASSPATTEA